MADAEKSITFIIDYNDQKICVDLLQFDTVEHLKIKIHEKLGIPPHKQILEGWHSVPECDQTILEFCSRSNDVNILTVQEVIDINQEPPTSENSYDNNEDYELESANSCLRKIKGNYRNLKIIIEVTKFENAMQKSCFAPLEKRKTLLLYLHNERNHFSTIFCRNMEDAAVAKIVNSSYVVVAWDIEQNVYHEYLKRALSAYDLPGVITIIESKISAAILISNVNGCITVVSCLIGNVSDADICKTLTNMDKFNKTKEIEEKQLAILEKDKGRENDMNSVNYQQLMSDMLGDRDYDSFEEYQLKYLKGKIGYALFGPPLVETGYNDKQTEKINTLFSKILYHSNLISEYKNCVEISFIYNCTEPTPAEKLARAKQYSDYNPNVDVCPVPIFVLRKCRNSPNNPCRIFIDDTGRVYKSWVDYIDNNKLGQCKMVLPRGGRYQVNKRGHVLLEKHMSPACGFSAVLLSVADFLSTGAALASGGIFLAAAATSLLTSPLWLPVAGVLGIGAGIYALGRSAHSLYDRYSHGESMSFANSEARGAYLNILAGALGFAGAGANMAVANLASKGFNFGRGAIITVNTIGVANVGVAGISLANSGYEVFCNWYYENQRPSLLTVVQLASSVLFFGNAVYSFKSAGTLIEESQTTTLRDYQDSLRSNRHRKTFNKLLKETIRQNSGNEMGGRAEVIQAVRRLPNKDDVFAVLTRSNKQMNRYGVKFSASGGEITLNGQSIDMGQFISMSKKDVNVFLSNLPSNTKVVAADTKAMSNIFSQFNFPNLDMDNVFRFSVVILGCFTDDTKQKIIETLSVLLNNLTDNYLQTLAELFPNRSKYYSNLLEFVVQFFGKHAKNFEDRYEKWEETGDKQYYMPLFDYVDRDTTRRCVKFFQEAVQMYFANGHFRATYIKELLGNFAVWLTEKVYTNEVERDRLERRQSSRLISKLVKCPKCKGSYFKNLKG